MSDIKKFINSIKNIPVKAPEPKFKVGDIIINHKFKVISRVASIKDIFENEQGSMNFESAKYVLKDVKNEALVEFLHKSGVSPEEQSTILRNKNRKREKLCQAIDPYYDKIEGKAAQILYGIKSEDT